MTPISAPPSFQTKTEARRALRAVRRRASDSYGAAAAAAVRDRFMVALSPPDGAVIAGYWPIGGELDPRPLLTELAASGFSCALPVAIACDAPLTFRFWTADMVLVPDALGIPGPPTDGARLEPDLFLLPLIGFDRLGHRLGQGAGSYDRTLAELRRRSRSVLAIGIGFAVQEMALVPAEIHDQSLDWIVTDRFALRLSAQE